MPAVDSEVRNPCLYEGLRNIAERLVTIYPDLASAYLRQHGDVRTQTRTWWEPRVDDSDQSVTFDQASDAVEAIDDVWTGMEQALRTSATDNGTGLPGMLIRDYPTVVRLSF